MNTQEISQAIAFLPLIALTLAVVVAIIFRKQLAALLGQLKGISPLLPVIGRLGKFLMKGSKTAAIKRQIRQSVTYSSVTSEKNKASQGNLPMHSKWGRLDCLVGSKAKSG